MFQVNVFRHDGERVVNDLDYFVLLFKRISRPMQVFQMEFLRENVRTLAIENIR